MIVALAAYIAAGLGFGLYLRQTAGELHRRIVTGPAAAGRPDPVRGIPMRSLVLPAIVVGCLAIMIGSTPAAAAPPARLLDRIVEARHRTHVCERALGLSETPVSAAAIRGNAYARWVYGRWDARAEATCRVARAVGTPAGAICVVFGDRCEEALSVARCESGLSTRAVNGQYLGLFQMGDYARGRYGHGSTPLEQARSAHAYFVDAGSDWGPWSCKP